MHVAHHLVKIVHLDAGRAQVGAPAADGLSGIRIGAAQLASRAYIDAAAAKPARLGFDIEGRPQNPALAASRKSDGMSHHLLLAHAHAAPAENAVLVFLSESLLADIVRRG